MSFGTTSTPANVVLACATVEIVPIAWLRLLKMSLSRKDESRMFVAAQLERGLGVYVKAEPNQGDTWRDTDIWHVTEHLAHEVEEVRRGVTLEAKYHNALDCVAQAAILAATIEQEIKRRLAEKP